MLSKNDGGRERDSVMSMRLIGLVWWWWFAADFQVFWCFLNCS